MHDNLFHHNHATAFGGGVYINFNTAPSVNQNTIVENRADINGGGLWFTDGSSGTAAHNIVALNTAPTGAGIMGYGTSGILTLSCNDVWGNPGGNYGGSIADQTGLNGNISDDPIFCAAFAGMWTLADNSPAASAACGLMGAFGVGCAPTPVTPTTWGAIKATYTARR